MIGSGVSWKSWFSLEQEQLLLQQIKHIITTVKLHGLIVVQLVCFLFLQHKTLLVIELFQRLIVIYPVGTLIIAMDGEGKTRGQIS